MPIAGEIHLWLREDGSQDDPAPPKAIAPGTRPPSGGLVVAVKAKRVQEARAILQQRAQIVARMGREPSEADIDLLARANPEAPEIAILRAVRAVGLDELVRDYGSGA